MFDRNTTTASLSDMQSASAQQQGDGANNKPRRRGLFRGLRRRKHKDRGGTGGFNADEQSSLSVPTAVWHEATTAGTSVNSQGAAKTTTPASTTAVTTTSTARSTTTPHHDNAALQEKAQHSWLFRNQRFRRMCDAVFHSIDTDNSGGVDEKELYAGLLLIHLKLGMYAGPAACRPLQRQRCQAVFKEMDTDNSGQLNQDEFRCVMITLFGNVILRVLVQWSMTLLIVPAVAQYILDALYYCMDAVYQFITTLDEDYAVANVIELQIEAMGRLLWDATPETLQSAVATLQGLLAKVPESVWNSVPLTLLSTILGILVVPWIIFNIDEFFTGWAARKHADQEETNIKNKSNKKRE